MAKRKRKKPSREINGVVVSEPEKVKRDEKGRLLPGSRLNPGGQIRQRTVDIAMLSRRHSPAALAQLVRIMEGKVADATVRDRIQAAKIIIERAHGKAPQVIDVTHAIANDPVELERAARSILAKRTLLSEQSTQYIDADWEESDGGEE